MNWKKILTDYFTFSRKDRVGIIALICLILLMIIIPYFYGSPKAPSHLKADSTLLNVTNMEQGSQTNHYPYTDSAHFSFTTNTNAPASSYNRNPGEAPSRFDPNTAAPPFPFDPNTLDPAGWKKLGLSDRTTRTILNYRSKGGRFYQKEDLQKIWGLPQGFYQHVEAFIRITPPKKYEQIAANPTTIFNNTKRERKITIVDINQADTTTFIALPGIGSKLAARIVNFRNKLGGFHSIDQIGETYGLPDSTFQMIRPYLQCPQNTIRKINLNTASKDELKTHPYIRWNLANAIVEYRNQHGNFTSLEDLKKISIIDEPSFKKLIPYISL